MSSSVAISLYKTICQKIKEGWNAEKFSAYFGVTRRRAQILIEKAVKYECGERSPHAHQKNFTERRSTPYGEL